MEEVSCAALRVDECYTRTKRFTGTARRSQNRLLTRYKYHTNRSRGSRAIWICGENWAFWTRYKIEWEVFRVGEGLRLLVCMRYLDNEKESCSTRMSWLLLLCR